MSNLKTDLERLGKPVMTGVRVPALNHREGQFKAAYYWRNDPDMVWVYMAERRFDARSDAAAWAAAQWNGDGPIPTGVGYTRRELEHKGMI